MLTLLKSLTSKYNPRIYVHADTDHGSLKKIKSLELESDNNFEVRIDAGKIKMILKYMHKKMGRNTCLIFLSFIYLTWA